MNTHYSEITERCCHGSPASSLIFASDENPPCVVLFTIIWCINFRDIFMVHENLKEGKRFVFTPNSTPLISWKIHLEKLLIADWRCWWFRARVDCCFLPFASAPSLSRFIRNTNKLSLLLLCQLFPPIITNDTHARNKSEALYVRVKFIENVWRAGSTEKGECCTLK